MNDEKKYIFECLTKLINIDEWYNLSDDDMIIYFLSDDHNVYKVLCGFDLGDGSGEMCKQFIDIEEFIYQTNANEHDPIDKKVFSRNNIHNIQDLLTSSIKDILKYIKINKYTKKCILKTIREIKNGLRKNNYNTLPSQWDHKVSQLSFNIKPSSCLFDDDCITYTRKYSDYEGLVLTTWKDAQEVLSKQEEVLLNYKLIKRYIVFGYVRKFCIDFDMPCYLTTIVEIYFC